MPIKALARMRKEGLLGDVVEDNEIAWFVLLSKVWGNPVFLAMQLESLSDKDLKSLIAKRNNLPLDKYILDRYQKAKKGQRISVTDLAIEAHDKFGVKISAALMDRIVKTRDLVRKKKRRVL
jgi:hypothetical protein